MTGGNNVESTISLRGSIGGCGSGSAIFYDCTHRYKASAFIAFLNGPGNIGILGARDAGLERGSSARGHMDSLRNCRYGHVRTAKVSPDEPSGSAHHHSKNHHNQPYGIVAAGRRLEWACLILIRRGRRCEQSTFLGWGGCRRYR